MYSFRRCLSGKLVLSEVLYLIFFFIYESIMLLVTCECLLPFGNTLHYWKDKNHLSVDLDFHHLSIKLITHQVTYILLYILHLVGNWQVNVVLQKLTFILNVKFRCLLYLAQSYIQILCHKLGIKMLKYQLCVPV